MGDCPGSLGGDLWFCPGMTPAECQALAQWVAEQGRRVGGDCIGENLEAGHVKWKMKQSVNLPLVPFLWIRLKLLSKPLPM